MWNLLGSGIEPMSPVNHWTSREILDIKYLTVIMAAWASLVAQLVKNPPAMCETWVRSWVGKNPWRREWLPTQYSGLENSMDCVIVEIIFRNHEIRNISSVQSLSRV